MSDTVVTPAPQLYVVICEMRVKRSIKFWNFAVIAPSAERAIADAQEIFGPDNDPWVWSARLEPKGVFIMGEGSHAA